MQKRSPIYTDLMCATCGYSLSHAGLVETGPDDTVDMFDGVFTLDTLFDD
jgi:hypothetical protein